jgi:hypothetical protein
MEESRGKWRLHFALLRMVTLRYSHKSEHSTLLAWILGLDSDGSLLSSEMIMNEVTKA